MAVGDIFYLFSGTIAEDAYWDIQPPAGEIWLISVIFANPYNNDDNISGVEVYGTNGTNYSRLSDLNVRIYQWSIIYHSFRVFIDHNNYMALKSTYGDKTMAVEGSIIKQSDQYMPGILGIEIGMTDPYGVNTIRPPVGEEWIVTEIGCNGVWKLRGNDTDWRTLSDYEKFIPKQAIVVNNDTYLIEDNGTEEFWCAILSRKEAGGA